MIKIYNERNMYNHTEGFSSEVGEPENKFHKGRFNLLPYINITKPYEYDKYDKYEESFYFSWLFLKMWSIHNTFSSPKITITYNGYFVIHFTIFKIRTIFKFKIPFMKGGLK